MSDPVPAITEVAAAGETAAIFADIRQVLGVDVVNLIWRHLATMEGALPWAWQALRPHYTDGSIVNEAAGLRQELALPAMPSIPAEVYAGLGLGSDDLVVIRRVLAAYDQTNAMAVLALTALSARLDGRVPRDATAAGSMPMPGTPQIPLPKLLDMAEMPPATAAIVTELNGFAHGGLARFWRACIATSLTGRPICPSPGCCWPRWTETAGSPPPSNRPNMLSLCGPTGCWSA
jgi:hypothetical protein